MSTHRDTCPMREGDSQRRLLVQFIGGPLDGLNAPMEPFFAQFVLVGPSCVKPFRTARWHYYRVAGPRRVEHVGEARLP